MVDKLHTPTAARQDWETPTDTFDYLDERFGPFDLDPACTPDQLTAMTILARGGRIMIPPPWPGTENMPSYSKDVLARITCDGLKGHWEGDIAWLNPPFNALGAWLHVATQNVLEGNVNTVCVLMPARTDTAYWQQYVVREVRRKVPWPNAPETAWTVDAHPMLHTVVNLAGRLTFLGADAPYTQPICAVVYGRNVKDKEHQ